MKRIAFLGLFLILLVGCVTAGDTLINAFNIRAAKEIQVTEDLGTAHDLAEWIESGSRQLEVSLGKADISNTTLDAAVYGAAVQASKDEHNNLEFWETKVGKVLKKVPWAESFVVLILGLFGIGKANLANDKIKAGYAGVSSILTMLKNSKEETLDREQVISLIKEAMRTEQLARDIWPSVQKDLAKLKVEAQI